MLLAQAVRAGVLASTVLSLGLPPDPPWEVKTIEHRSADISQITYRRIDSLIQALEGYRRSFGVFPAVASLSELEIALAPTFVIMVPETDGWGTRLEVRVEAERWLIASAGPDLLFERDWRACAADCPSAPNSDDRIRRSRSPAALAARR